jgi:hypothetical protein
MNEINSRMIATIEKNVNSVEIIDLNLLKEAKTDEELINLLKPIID